MGISPDITQIDKVELSAHRIADTEIVHSFPYQLLEIQPRWLGGLRNQQSKQRGFYIEIYGFNATTSGVTPVREAIYVPAGSIPGSLPSDIREAAALVTNTSRAIGLQPGFR